MRFRTPMMSALLALTVGGVHGAAPTADELLQAVDELTPEQAQTVRTKLEAKRWEPVSEGFFSRLGVEVGLSVQSLDRVDLQGLSPSAGPFDLDTAGGMEVGLLWRVLTPGLRLGLRLGGYGAEDSELVDAGYSRTTLMGSHTALAANYQFLRSDRWLAWVEGSVGSGTVDVESVDTPTGAATTLRELNGDYVQGELRAGVAWRPNPVLSLLASVGYRFAEECTLDEGGRGSELAVDASGVGVQLGLGINF